MIDSITRGGVGLSRPDAAPDPGFAARARLARLRDTLAGAASARPSRWNEPAVFFFDPRRQAELDAARPECPHPLANLTALIASERPALIASVEVRRVARATDGLRAAAERLAPRLPAARELAALLAIPDDEVFFALSPLEGTGVRLHVRGAATVADLHRRLAPELGLEAFQLFAPAVLRAGGLASGLSGCAHWLWPTQPLSAVPRVGGERVVVVGPATVPAALDFDPPFPGLAVECERVQTLTAEQVADASARLAGGSRLKLVPLGPPVARAA